MKPHFIQTDADLSPVAAFMLKAARIDPLTEEPKYSPSPEVATAKALANVEKIAANPCNQLLVFLPEKYLVTVILSVDTYDDWKRGQPCWHLSMSNPNVDTRQPDRVQEGYANRILKAFFDVRVEEGPPEGAYKNVRHFRTDYLPDLQ